MDFLVKYHGSRAETLKSYNPKYLRNGPYNFSANECNVDEKDAERLVRENPKGFSIVGPAKVKVVVSGETIKDEAVKPVKPTFKK
jgi:hypothetical protein